MEYGKAPKRLGLMTALSVAGLGLGVTLSQHYYSLREGTGSFRSFCNLGSNANCDVVALSRFSELVGGIPLSSFVAGWFLAFFIITLIARMVFWRREAMRALLLMSAVSVAISAIYFGVMTLILHTFCLYCLIVDVVNLVLLVLVISLKPEGIREHKPELKKWRTFSFIGLFCIFVGVVGLKSFESERLNAATESEMVNYVLQTPPVAMGDLTGLPLLGKTESSAVAPIEIVEFSDFQCPFCRVGALTLTHLESRYLGKIKVIFRNYPLNSSCNKSTQASMHPAACEAAKVAVCSQKLGKFKEVYEKLFELQETLAPGKPQAIAESVGIDSEALKACLIAPETDLALVRDTDAGAVLGLRSTPTFFINGLKVEGAYPLSAWIKIVDALLAKK